MRVPKSAKRIINFVFKKRCVLFLLNVIFVYFCVSYNHKLERHGTTTTKLNYLCLCKMYKPKLIRKDRVY